MRDDETRLGRDGLGRDIALWIEVPVVAGHRCSDRYANPSTVAAVQAGAVVLLGFHHHQCRWCRLRIYWYTDFGYGRPPPIRSAAR